MAIKKRIHKKIRTIGKQLRSVLFPTETEIKRNQKREYDRLDRYEKYIPHFSAKTFAVSVSWFFLGMFIYFMIFGISVTERSEKTNLEARKKYTNILNKTGDIVSAYNAAQEYKEKHPVTNDIQMQTAWNYIMKPLHLENATYLNWLILLEGSILGLAPTLVLAHRKRIIDKMYSEKWKLISLLDNTDIKIIYNMSKDSSSYFYHLVFSLTDTYKIKKYKKIAIPIIKGYIDTHPEDDKKVNLILEKFTQKNR